MYYLLVKINKLLSKHFSWFVPLSLIYSMPFFITEMVLLEKRKSHLIEIATGAI